MDPITIFIAVLAVIAFISIVWWYRSSVSAEHFGVFNHARSSSFDDIILTLDDADQCGDQLCSVRYRKNRWEHREPSDSPYFSMYRYPWYLSTRGMTRVPYYPYFYGNYYVDRYGRFFPQY